MILQSETVSKMILDQVLLKNNNKNCIWIPKVNWTCLNIVECGGKRKVLVAQLSQIFATSWTLQGSSVHETLQAKFLGWVAILFSRGSS